MPLARTSIAAVAAALLFGGVAMAQPATPANSSPDNNANPPAQDQSTPAPAATTSDQSMPSDTATPATSAGSNVSATADSGGVQVIASQPVPDTPANRAKYGKPMSNAGKRTAPAGN